MTSQRFRQRLRRVFTRSKSNTYQRLGDYLPIADGEPGTPFEDCLSAVQSSEDLTLALLAEENRQAGAGPSTGTDEEEEVDGRMTSSLAMLRPQAQVIEEDAYWGPTREISDDKLLALAKRIIDAKDGQFLKVVDKCFGSYNVAYILESKDQKKICIRVPACGFPARWNDHDADLLRSAALGMKHLHEKTDLPTPKMLGYSNHMRNEISAPFVIMSFLPGVPLHDLWNRRDDESESATERRRQTLLRNLAQTMPRLQSAVFPRFGALKFELEDSGPRVGDTSRLDQPDIFAIHREFVTLPSKGSVGEFMLASKAQRFQEDGYPEKTDNHTVRGCYVLWELMIDCFLSSTRLESGKPEFCLMQSDFNMQNILVNDQGEITGLIDWDCLEAVPRQKGWSALPHWLMFDWNCKYLWPPADGIENSLLPEQYEKYRNDYTTYIREACPGHNDTRFTSKSHVYQTLLSSGEHFENVQSFVANVLGVILPRCAGYLELYINGIGVEGFRKGEKEWLKKRLKEFFAPDEAPETNGAPSEKQ